MQASATQYVGHGAHSGTFRGNNLAFVTATQALETYWANTAFTAEIQRKERLVRDWLENLVHSYPNAGLSVRGRGLIQGLVSNAIPALSNRIAANALWPKTVIQTAALRMVDGAHHLPGREPQIMADAAYAIFNRPSREATGNFYIDEEVLRAEGVSDFSRYASDAGGPLAGDFFVPDEAFERTDTKVTRAF